MQKDALEKAGLSSGEARAYLAMLGLGDSSVGPIARESGVSRSKIYEVLERLLAKGLASTVFIGKKKLYRASSPQFLTEFLDKQQNGIEEARKTVEKLIPSLMSMQKSEAKTVELYGGFRGLKHVRDNLLTTMKKGDVLLILGAPKIANEKWETYLWNYHQKREEMGIGMHILYNLDAKKYGEKRKGLRLSKVRYLPDNLLTPTWFEIFNDNVLMVVVPQNIQPYSILINDEPIAFSFRSYFNLLWKTSR